MGIEVLIPIFGILLILVPVTGLTLILTIRFAFKPLVETLAQALRDSGYTTAPELQARVDDLTEQLELVTGELHRLREKREFDRQLARGPDAGDRPG